MGAPGTTENVAISKCPCGDRMCSSYRLSNQGSVGFSIGDAHQMAASGELYDALKAFVDHYPSGINSYLDDAAIAGRAALAKATFQ